jgi:molybdopterin-guanine dinucleotide biosynthesis adapter protein
MAQKSIPVISIVGHSNSGKTTFLEKLVPVLNARGFRVATIKHDVHDFQMDREGKDSYRHKKAGAVTSMIASPRKIALVEDLDRELTVAEIVSRHVRDVDLVITEGYKREEWPKIEVYRTGKGRKPVCQGDENLIALVADKIITADVPVFSWDDAEGVADLILSRVAPRGSRG